MVRHNHLSMWSELVLSESGQSLDLHFLKKLTTFSKISFLAISLCSESPNIINPSSSPSVEVIVAPDVCLIVFKTAPSLPVTWLLNSLDTGTNSLSIDSEIQMTWKPWVL